MVARFWKKKPKSPLDHVLWNWGTAPMSVRGLLDGGLCVFGRSGSAKTSGSGKLVGRSIVHHGNSGGLILAAKPEDVAMWRKIFAEAGRADDLIVVEPSDIWRLNVLDYLVQAGADTREVTHCLMSIAEVLTRGDGGGDSDGGFWRKGQERKIYNAIVILRQAYDRVSAPDLLRFINGAASDPTQLSSPEWQGGFHNQTMRAAYERPKTPAEQHDFELSSTAWLSEYPQMSSRTRSSILAGVQNLLHTFNTSLSREMVSSITNVSPDDMLKRKFVLVNLPPTQYGPTGSFVNAAWKTLTQWRMLRRQAEPGDCINVIWVDEAHQFFNSFDAPYLAQCRSRNGCMVYLSQSLASYYAAVGGEDGRHAVDAFFSNFGTKVFHALGDVQTAELASNLIGKTLQTFVGGSTSPQGGIWDELTGNGRYSGSFSQHFEAAVQPRELMTGLRTGGPMNGFLSDAIVVRSGEPFSSGRNWLKATFSQK
jgi:hypothetical protein